LVEANQGSIGFRSAPGCGAAFQVSFSLAAG
jgi:signal transduction histidine kinase